MLRLSLLFVLVVAMASCSSIKAARLADVTGSAGQPSVSVRVVDPRTGQGYAGTLSSDGTTSTALGGGILPAVVRGSASGVTVDAVKVEKKP